MCQAHSRHTTKNIIFSHCHGTILKSVPSGTDEQEPGAPPDTVEVGRFLPYEAGMLNKLFSPFGLSFEISATEIQSSSNF